MIADSYLTTALVAAVVALSFYILVRLGILASKDAIAGSALGVGVYLLWRRFTNKRPAPDTARSDEIKDATSLPAASATDAASQAGASTDDQIRDAPTDAAALQRDLKTIADR